MAIDLSALKSNPEAREPIEVDAAFMVVIRDGGRVIQASPDINAPIKPQREVSLDEMQTAARRIYDDIQATKVANLVQMSVQQAAAAQLNQAQNARLAQSLKL
jgi:hypothetical protein